MDPEVNYFAIAKVLGATVRPVKGARFGNFSLLETTAEAVRSLHSSADVGEEPAFSYEQDRIIVQAFEDVRQGAAPDSILWDRVLAEAFFRRCRELGVVAADAVLGRRLMMVRKNGTRFKQHGIVISRTTKKVPRTVILPQYAHVIEFALVRLRYRYGASIDDILLDRELGTQFEELVSQIVPGLQSQDLRLGALYIRKTREIKKREAARVASLDLRPVEEAWRKPVTLAAIHPDEVPDVPGLIELKEGDRYLYIARNEDLQSAVRQMHSGHGFDIMANTFWTPSLESITVQLAPGERIGRIETSLWERRLIHDFEPVFNWPLQETAA